MSVGSGGGDNLTISVATNITPANAAVAISPTGTGTVAISPAGALTINPTTASTINNTSIGATTASTGRFTSVTATTGNVVIGTSGQGIDFSATAGTGTSELLADYEEGTWTPTIGGNATYLAQEGYYTKVGRIVTIQGKIQINVIGTGSTTTISGLPYAQLSASSASNSGGGVSYFAGIATSVYTLIPYVINGNTTIIFESQTAAGFTSSNYQTTVFQGGTRLDFFLTYTAAS
jgi:hypothetical protein